MLFDMDGREANHQGAPFPNVAQIEGSRPKLAVFLKPLTISLA